MKAEDSLFTTMIDRAGEMFTGGDFSYLSVTGRMDSGMLSWSYGSLVEKHMCCASSLLGMGTGGGEFLSRLHPFPPEVFATEGYEPNVPIARERLEPLGVRVSHVKDNFNLPFRDGQFDLVVNRHESYAPQEVRRTLADGGLFVTQQVGGLDSIRINELFGAPANDE